MPAPTFAWKPHALAYAWLARRLVKSPLLDGKVTTWVTRVDGMGSRTSPGPDDDNPPVDAMCPWVRLTPTAEPGRVVGKVGDRIVRLAPLLVRVETCVAGFSPADAANLADAVWLALFDGYFSTGNLPGMYAAFVNSIQEVQPPIAGETAESGTGLIYSAGSIRLNVRA